MFRTDSQVSTRENHLINSSFTKKELFSFHSAYFRTKLYNLRTILYMNLSIIASEHLHKL